MSSFERYLVYVDDQVVSDRLLTWFDANVLAHELLKQGRKFVTVSLVRR